MKTALSIGLTALLVGALAFYGGVMYGKTTARGGFGVNAAAGRNWQGRNGATGANAQNAVQRFRGGFANGEVISADAKSITVKSADGSTRTVYFDSSTRVLRSSEATLTDLAKGTTVVVIGAAGADGSVTARSVQIVPKGSNLEMFGGGMRNFGSANQGTQNGGTSQNGGTQGQQGGPDGGGMGAPPDGAGGPPPGF